VKLPFNIEIQGMALAAIIGVLLNLILPGRQSADENMFEKETTEDTKTA
jgi:uracil permease